MSSGPLGERCIPYSEVDLGKQELNNVFKQSTYDFSTSHYVNMVKKSLFKDRGAILYILQEYEEIQPSSKASSSIWKS